MSEHQREESCAAIAAPANLSAALAGYRWARDTVGESGGSVYRLHGQPGRPDLYLKHGRGRIADEVTDELARLRWVGAHLPVPEVHQFVGSPEEAWLLMGALPGQTAYQRLEASPDDRIAVVDAVVHFLRRLHSIPVAECPFNSDHRFRLVRAERRMAAGLVDTDGFDEERQGWSDEQVWRQMTELLPLSPDAVVTHGDFSLDNLLLQGDEVVGCIDVGRAGIADRYQDLAILWNCLGEFGAELQQRMFASYGIDILDERKLRFHLMLDEFF